MTFGPSRIWPLFSPLSGVEEEVHSTEATNDRLLFLLHRFHSAKRFFKRSNNQPTNQPINQLRAQVMGKFDDSFGIGDLPTNYELGLVEEDDEDSIEVPEQQPDTVRRKRPPKPASVNSSSPQKQQQQQQPAAPSQVVEGIEHDHDVVSKHGKWIVVLVLCLSAAGMGYVTFSYISRNEREEFEATVSNF